MKFGFEADVLEANLNEAYDVVDKFFIIEATRAHFRRDSKPLVLDHLFMQLRFAKFREKVVHLVIDDSVYAGSRLFEWEKFSERSRWEKFLEWNDHYKFFSDDDILFFGDADEIPSREIQYYTRWCHMQGIVNLGIWFTFSDVRAEFRSWCPTREGRYLMAAPTAYPLKQARLMVPPGYPSQKHCSSPYTMASGIHMTSYPYFPNLVLKSISATEARYHQELVLIQKGFLTHTTPADILRGIRSLWRTIWPTKFRLINGTVEANGRVIPWFVKCNPHRYPYFFGDDIEDKRLHLPLDLR